MTLGDDVLLTAVLSGADAGSEAIDQRTTALVRLAALIAVDADAPAYQCEVRHALDAGATPEQLTAVLLALAPVAGSALVMSAAPKLALALGYDVEAGLEDGDVREDGS
jgi:alkylhydroperoxidase/carboxymuconolactone decarboxylase family protein YurZ